MPDRSYIRRPREIYSPKIVWSFRQSNLPILLIFLAIILVIICIIVGIVIAVIYSATNHTPPGMSSEVNPSGMVEMKPSPEESLLVATQEPHPTITDVPLPVFNISPTSTLISTPRPTSYYCSGALPPRLEADEDASICTKKDSVFLREGHGPNYAIIDKLPTGTIVWVLEGPFCADQANWWKVRTNSGTIGWMREGSDDKDPYFLCPR